MGARCECVRKSPIPCFLDLLHFCHTHTHTQELKDTLEEELDFEHEGHNQEQCARNFRHLPYVYTPKIYWDLTTKVLSKNTA